MSVTYRLTSEVVADEYENEYISYGISAINREGTVVASVSNIFLNIEYAKEIVDKCNKNKLSIVHLMDVIDDALTEQRAL